MWERWNSFTKEQGFGDPGMNSFNHYAYGAIGEWMYNTVAGIELDPVAPAYKHIIIRPQPPTQKPAVADQSVACAPITWARGELLTRYGKVTSQWKIENKSFALAVTIPANTRATIILPGRKPQKVGAGKWTFTQPDIS